LNEKAIEFRNEVVHQGKIPTRSEAVAFGEEILRLIRAQIYIMTQTDDGLVERAIRSQVLEAKMKLKPGVQSGVTVQPMTLSLETPTVTLSLSETIEKLQKKKRFLEAFPHS
jgi:hypothetical protein